MDIDFDTSLAGSKTSEGDGVTAAQLEADAADCGCGMPGGCQTSEEDC